MKFATTIAMIDPSFYIPLARAAEEIGFDTIAVPDSIAYPRASSSKYPYNPDGTREFLENKPFLETMNAISAMGAATERVEFHTFVLKMPMRHPIVLAKEATSIAVITGNRLVLGVGSSPWPDDYEILELPWERRGRRFDECIDVVRGLSAGGYFEYHGEFYDFPAIKLNPIPTEPIPILIGGHSDANLRRAARVADGWMAAGGSPEDTTRWITRIQELRRTYGREHEPFDIYATTFDSFSPDGIRRLEDLGVTHTSGGFGRFNPYGIDADTETLQEKIDNLRRYADDVIAGSAVMDPVSVASTYLDALVSREAESALLAPDVRRFHNGAVIVQGADEIRAILRREPLAGMGDRRWVVDGEHAIVFYDLHADMARATGSGGPPDTWIPAYVAERFLVRDEVVHEIDPIFFADVAKRPHPERPMRYPVGDDDRDSVLRIAQSYVAALESHDASTVPLADLAYRIENGVYMGNRGSEIRSALQADGMSIISGIDDVRWYAGTGSAAAFYTLSVDAGDAGTVVCKIGERFRTYDGELVEIEVVYSTETIS